MGTLMSACQSAQQWLQALHLAGEALQSGLWLDAISCNLAILAACASRSQSDLTWALLDIMDAQSLEPDILTFSQLLMDCEQRGLLGREVELICRFAVLLTSKREVLSGGNGTVWKIIEALLMNAAVLRLLAWGEGVEAMALLQSAVRAGHIRSLSA